LSLDAARATELALSVTEAGGSAASLLVVADPTEELAGRRLVLVRPASADPDVLHGSLGSEEHDAAARALAIALIEDPDASDGLHDLTSGGRALEVYVEIRRAVRELLIVGAGHIARPLCTIGSLLGFRVVVLDDRPEFATRERFPSASRLVQADFTDPFREVSIRPGSHVLLVTRGHRYDYECLVRILAVDPPPTYIGMIGSRRRVRATFARLLEEGVPRDRLKGIHSPVGLDIHAETPEEIAVAVAAELVKVRRGGTGASLKDVERVAERFFPDEA